MLQVKYIIKIISILAIGLSLSACIIVDADDCHRLSSSDMTALRRHPNLNDLNHLQRFERYAPSSRQYARIERHNTYKDNHHTLVSKPFHIDERLQPRLDVSTSKLFPDNLNSHLTNKRTYTKIHKHDKIFPVQQGQVAPRPVQHRSFKNAEFPSHTYNQSSNKHHLRTKRSDSQNAITQNQDVYVAKRPVQHHTIQRN